MRFPITMKELIYASALFLAGVLLFVWVMERIGFPVYGLKIFLFLLSAGLLLYSLGRCVRYLWKMTHPAQFLSGREAVISALSNAVLAIGVIIVLLGF